MDDVKRMGLGFLFGALAAGVATLATKKIKDCHRFKQEELQGEDDYDGNVDGIINPDRYRGSDYQIAWILKEANSKGNGTSSIRDYCGHVDLGSGDNTATKRIALASYCIENDYDDVDNVSISDDDLKQELQNIAWIPICKEGASDECLQQSYDENKNGLLEQIDDAEPSIIIFGGTFDLFKNDLEERGCSLSKLEFEDSLDCDCYIDDDDDDSPLYIDYANPSGREYGINDYASTIVKAVRAWEKDVYELPDE
jgi:hypothetical protein